MQAFIVVLPEPLPVARDHFHIGMGGHKTIHGPIVERMGAKIRHVLEIRRIVRQADEDKTVPDFHVHLEKAVIRLPKIRCRRGIRNANEVAFQIVGPFMIGAGDKL